MRTFQEIEQKIIEHYEKLGLLKQKSNDSIQKYFNHLFTNMLDNESSYSELYFYFIESQKVIGQIHALEWFMTNDGDEKYGIQKDEINNIKRPVTFEPELRAQNLPLTVNNIIYLKTWGGIGDCLMLTPAIRSLKLVYPEKLLKVYCTYPEHYQILLNNLYVDEFVDENCYLENEKYFMMASYADLFPSLAYPHKASKIICEMLKTDFIDDKLELFLLPNEIEKGKSALSEFKNPVCINPSSVCSKNHMWDLNKWAELIKRSNNKIDYIQIGKQDEPLLKGSIDYRGKFSLREFLSILNSARGFIGMDSFWNHASNALGVRAIILFGDSTPAVWGVSTG